jgi:hypothetical protein
VLLLQNYPFDMEMKLTKAHTNLRLSCITLQKQQAPYMYFFRPFSGRCLTENILHKLEEPLGFKM